MPRFDRVRHLSATLIVSAVLLANSPGQLRKTGLLKVYPHCAIDLDAGVCECVVTLDDDGSTPPSHPSSKDDDFRLEPSGSRFYLQPRHGTMLSKIPSDAPATACVAAEYANGKLRVDDLPAGARICARTNEGRFAELQVEEAIRRGINRMLLSYKIWER